MPTTNDPSVSYGSSMGNDGFFSFMRNVGEVIRVTEPVWNRNQPQPPAVGPPNTPQPTYVGEGNTTGTPMLAAAPSSSMAQYTPLIIGAGVILAVVLLAK